MKDFAKKIRKKDKANVQPPRGALGVRAKLLLALGAIAVFIITTTVISLNSFSNISRTITDITGERIPAMARAMNVGQKSSELSSALPLLNAADNSEARESIYAQIRQDLNNISPLSENLSDTQSNSELASLEKALSDNIDTLNQNSEQRISDIAERTKMAERIRADHQTIDLLLLQEVEKASKDLYASADTISQEAVSALDHLLSKSLERINSALNIKAEINRLIIQFNKAISVEAPEYMHELRTEASSAVENIEEHSVTLEDVFAEIGIDASISKLIEFEQQDNNLFDLVDEQLIAISEFNETLIAEKILELNALQSELSSEISSIVDDAYFDLVITAEHVQELNSSSIPVLMSSGVSSLRILLELRASLNLMFGILSEAAELYKTQALDDARTRLDALNVTLKKLQQEMEEKGSYSQLLTQLERFFEYGDKDTGLIKLQRSVAVSIDTTEQTLQQVNLSIGTLQSLVEQKIDQSRKAVENASAGAENIIQQRSVWLKASVIVSLLFTFLIAWLLVTRHILGRLLKVIRDLQALANGDMSHSETLVGSDELAQLSGTVDVFRERLLENESMRINEKKVQEEREKQEQERLRLLQERQVAEQNKHRMEQQQAQREREQAEKLKADTDALLEVVNAAAMGDLTRNLRIDGDGPTSKMANALQSLLSSMSEILSRIQDSANGVSDEANKLAKDNADLSARTERQSTSLQQTARSMKQMTTSVHNNSENTRSANELSNTAYEAATRGTEAVRQIAGAMTAINDSSRKIAEIIEVIDDISLKTNLLALNAAVEAARAGEQGRGFAVVAAEVRDLAGRSATAASEIKTIIEDSAAKVTAGVNLVDESGAILERLQSSVGQVKEIISEIADSSEAQSTEIGSVDNAIQQMDQMTDQNARLVEKVALQSESMASEAERLQQHVSIFTFQDISDQDSEAHATRAA